MKVILWQPLLYLESWGYLAAVRDITRLPIAMGSYGNHDWLHIAISLYKKSKIHTTKKKIIKMLLKPLHLNFVYKYKQIIYLLITVFDISYHTSPRAHSLKLGKYFCIHEHSANFSNDILGCLQVKLI